MFNALATNPTTGAAATTINPGDTLDGGDGDDVLNITATATNNNSLTGLTVSNIETVNITGANFFGAESTSPASAVAGAKQVQVLDIGNLSLEAEQQTIDFVGTAKSTTAAALDVDIAGVTVTTASIAADATAATVATAVATAINTAAAANGALNGIVASASATSGVVTVNFTAAAGDVADITVGTGLVTAGTTSPVTLTGTEAKASSAEIQSISITTGALAIGDTATFTNLGTGSFVFTAAAAANQSDTASAIVDAVNAAIAAEDLEVANLARAEVSGSTVNFIFKATVGDASASAVTFSAAGIAATGGVNEARKGGEVDLTVTVNGAQYTVTSVVDGDVLSATAADAAAAQLTSQANARTAINTKLTEVIGDAFEVGVSDQANEIKLTAKMVGVSAPVIGLTGRDSAANLLSVDAADAATVANAVRTGATAVAQQIQYTFGGTVEAADGFNLFINGTNFGTVLAGSTPTPTPGVIAEKLAAAVNAVLGEGVAVAAGGTVTITAPVAGTPLPIISLVEVDANNPTMTLGRTDVRENVAPVGSVTTLGAAAVDASQFVGSEEIWLVGASGDANVTKVTASQQVGFRGVTALDNEVSFGATVKNASLASEGSRGTVTLKGAGLESVSLAGTTAGIATAALKVVDGNTVKSIKTLTADTSGATVIDTVSMTALTTVVQNGAGALSLNTLNTAAATKLASVTTGAGADNIRITTATAADNPATTIDETVSAVVSTGAGNDRVVVATSATGTGTTTVDLGDGNDTLILTTIGTGANSLSGGAGNDTFIVGAISALGTTKIDGGSGTDTLRTSQGDSFGLAQYTTLTANVSNVEVLQLTSNVSALDASKIEMSRIEFFGAGNNVVTEVSSSQQIVAARTPVSAAAFGVDAVTTEVVPTNVTATAKDYKAATVVNNVVTVPTVFGDNLNIAMTHVSNNSSVIAKGGTLDLSVTALGERFVATSSTANVTGIDSKVTLSGDIQALNAVLTSVRGVGTTATPAAFGVESLATLSIVLDSDGETTGGTQTLLDLETVTVSGAGVVTIDARTDANDSSTTADAVLTTIDLSGMTAFADLNDKGQEIGAIGGNANVVGGFRNLSKSTVTLDIDVAETVLLGGAQDTVVTASTIEVMDTISGFQLVASAANPLLVDTARSDILELGVNFTTTNAVAIEVTGSTLEAALLQAASAKNADGTADRENVVFHFGGDTYVYVDNLDANNERGLSDNDILVRLTGELDLNLLISGAAIIA